MISLLAIFGLCILFGIFVPPLLWLCFGKLLGVKRLEFKACFRAYLWLISATILLYFVTTVFIQVVEMDGAILTLIMKLVIAATTVFVISLKLKTNIWRGIGIYLLTMICLSLAALIVRNSAVQAFKIPSAAMMPSVLIGDHILCNKLAYGFQSPFGGEYLGDFAGVTSGDIIVFDYPENPSKAFIKRVVGLPGDTVEIRNKKVIVNGNVITEPYAVYNDTNVYPLNITARDNMAAVVVPDFQYFVLGDNRDNSHDSRFWGFVPKDMIRGRVFSVYWSWDRQGRAVRWDRIGVSF